MLDIAPYPKTLARYLTETRSKQTLTQKRQWGVLTLNYRGKGECPTPGEVNVWGMSVQMVDHSPNFIQ